MKKILFFAALVATCSLSELRADTYNDFGTLEEGMAAWKGDFAVGDVNGDGHLDILFAGEENAWIMLGDGQGGFTKQTEACPFTKGLIGDIALGDIDGDGDLDVIYATWNTGSATSRGIAINDGNGVFTAASREQYPIIESYEVLTREGEEGMTTVNIDKFTSCGFADFNLDGLLDYYFFANYTVGRRDKLDENGQPVLDENNNPVKEEIPGSFRNNKVIYFQNADGTFTPDENFFTTTEYRINEPEVTVIDFDGDGTPDIWMNGGNEANECDNGNQTGDSQRFSRLFKNDNGLNFFEYNLGENGVSFEKSNGTSSWADVDGDGYLDLLHHGDGYLCSGETDDTPNRVYRNLNGSGLEEKFMVKVARDGYFSNGTTWVDWNGDGVLDFISGGWDAGNNTQSAKLYLGDASDPFTFTPAAGGTHDFMTMGVSEQAFRVADLNEDGRPDVLVCGHGSIGRRVTGWVANETATPVADMEAPVLNNVAIDNGEEVMITFSWMVPASLTGKRGLTWNLALKNVTTGKWLYNPMSNPETGECFGGRLGNVSTATTYNLYNLPAGTYEWTVQAIDASGFSGAFAAKQTFTIGASGVASVSGYNPAVFVNDNTLSIVGMQGEAQTVNVYSISGALLNTAAFNDNIDLQLPQAGIYMVEVRAADGGQYITKVVVK